MSPRCEDVGQLVDAVAVKVHLYVRLSVVALAVDIGEPGVGVADDLADTGGA